MLGWFREKLGSFCLSRWPWAAFWLVLIAVELLHLKILFGGASFLAGGDNYTYLLLGRQKLYPFIWDNFYAFGIKSFTVPNLMGFQLYTVILPFLSGPILERLLIFSLHLLKFVFFIKLARLFFAQSRSLALLPPILFLAFNAFASLNPYSYYQLLYSAYLPLFLYYFIKIFENKGFDLANVSKLILWSILAAPVNANPALSATIFIPPTVYLLLNFKTITRTTIKNLLLLGLLWLAANLWWLYPLFSYFLSVSGSVIRDSGWFTAVSVGNLFQNFRLIGQWGWYGNHFLHAYYPYSAYYDSPLVILTTFFLVGAVFYEATRNDTLTVTKKKRLYLLGLVLGGLFLVAGTRVPFGFFYQILFDFLPGFRIFREPFTKFSEIYALGFSLLLFLFLVRLSFWRSRWLGRLAFLAVVISVLVSIKPGYLAEGVVDYWNGSVRTARVEIPSYWEEFSHFAAENLGASRLLTSPRVTYGNAWNWPKGFSSGDDLAVVFSPETVNVVRAPLATGAVEEEAVSTFFKVAGEPEAGVKFLSLLGVDYVLQENDLDWRYSRAAADPLKMKERLSKFLTFQKSFGRFDGSYLERIPNQDPNLFVSGALAKKLWGQPALELYGLAPENKVSRIYAPTGVVVAAETSFSSLHRLLASGRTQAGDLYLEESERGDVSFLNFDQEIVATNSAQVLGRRFNQSRIPNVEVKRINPTYYSVRLTGATDAPFWLAFLDRFDEGWKLYQTESPGKINQWPGAAGGPKAMAEQFHFKANGFANAWLVDPKLLGLNLETPADELNLILEYQPQRYFNLFLLLLGLVSFGSALCLILLFARKNIWKKT